MSDYQQQQQDALAALAAVEAVGLAGEAEELALACGLRSAWAQYRTITTTTATTRN